MSTEALAVHVDLPAGVKAHVKGRTLTVEGPLGKVTRKFPSAVLDLKVSGTKATITLTAPVRKASRALLLTWERHLANLGLGVTVGFTAKLKAVAAHFPMKVYPKEDRIVIENFLGEKHPRQSFLRGGTKAKVEGEEVILEGNDIEAVGQSAANLERATHIRDYDPRVFQDGIYITVKPHPKGG